MEPWTIITEVSLQAQIKQRSARTRQEFFAAQDLFREEGPDAFELHAPYLTGDPSWDQLSKACNTDLWIQVGRSWFWMELEILPGKTVIFRRGRLE